MKMIEANHISKKYIISHLLQDNRPGKKNIFDYFKKDKRPMQPASEEFWALKDISFTISEGERVGIIGRNGSGKSTLLKILSQITKPSSGTIALHGRVASLLEVGTGFHPDLTGRENIFMNGAILGISKKEISKKIDSIIAFSEVERFIDTPVKYYSSGMYMRLAFSVAAHLDPDILIADEVLAVGDASFQKKCIEKMRQLADNGRTLLLVSHNINLLKETCDSAMLLEKGELVRYDTTDTVIDNYLNQFKPAKNVPLEKRTDRRGNGLILFNNITCMDRSGNVITTAEIGQALSIHITFVAPSNFYLASAAFGVSIINKSGDRVSCIYTESTKNEFTMCAETTNKIEIKIDHLPLIPGNYHFNLYATINNQVADHILEAETLLVTANERDDQFSLAPIPSRGLCYIKHDLKLTI